MNARAKKFFSYYKPYLGLFFADMISAIIVSLATLAIPLCIRYIIKNLLETGSSFALHEIYMMGALLIALVAIYAACHSFIDYRGH
ncbi:MAG: ABC transporter ATP-binding protein, partial [Chlamydiae bacterium]|nr:ABC transporter ATP-binding protein [Chlamydiota bacterium]